MSTTENTISVAEYLLLRMRQMGIGHVFGVPGDFVIPFLDVMMEQQKSNKDAVKYVGTCNELNAAYAADGYARLKGVGALVTTYVVGELSALNGVAGSFAEKVPVVAITGTPARAAFQGNWLLHHTIGEYKAPSKMYKRVTAANTILIEPERVPSDIDKVLRTCLLKQLPVYIGLPSDMVNVPVAAPTAPLFRAELPKSSEMQLTHEVLSQLMELEFQRDNDGLQEAVAEAVDMINSAQRPIFIAGVELKRYRLQDSFKRLVEKSGIPYTTMMMGKAVLDEDCPMFIGLYEGKTSRDYVRKRVEESDCIVILGEWLTDLNTGGFSAQLPQQRLIHANIERVVIRHHMYRDIYLKNFIEDITSKLNTRDAKEMDIHPASQGCVHRAAVQFKAEGSKKLAIGRIFDRLSSFLQPNCVVLADVGTSLYSAAETMMPKGATFIGQTFFGSIGYTLGASLGAAVAVNNERQVVLLIGDGAFQMTCQDLSTIIRQKLKVSVVLINNNGYTIERLISDPGYYNDVASWKYHQLPAAFGGGEQDLTFDCYTEGDLEKALQKIENEAEKVRLAFIEVHSEKMDAAEALRAAGKFMSIKSR